MNETTGIDIPMLNGGRSSEEDRRRRGAGIPWFPRTVPGQGLWGYTLSGVAGSKFGVVGLIGLLVAGSAAVGTRLRHQDEEAARRRAARKVAMSFSGGPNADAPAGAAMTQPRNAYDGMAYIKGGASADGAAPGAGAGAGQGAASADAAKESAGAADSKGADAKDGAPAAQDPAAMAAAMAAQAGAQTTAGAGKRFGQLSSSFGGGGLAGGAGLSGGINQQFAQKKLENSLLAQATPMKGGMSPGLRSSRPMTGSLGKSALRGATGKRLEKMAGAMGANRQGNETSAAVHTAEWSNAPPAGGQSLGGPGASMPSAGGGVPEQSVASSEGGPVPYQQPAPASQPDIGNVQDVTPYQGLVDMAKILMMVAMGLLLVATILGLIAKSSPPPANVTLYAIAKYMAYAAMAVSAIVTMMGIAILAYGQTLQGLLFTGIGAIMTFASYRVAEDSSANEQAKAAEAAKAATTDTQTGANLADKVATPQIPAGEGGGGPPPPTNPNPPAPTSAAGNEAGALDAQGPPNPATGQLPTTPDPGTAGGPEIQGPPSPTTPDAAPPSASSGPLPTTGEPAGPVQGPPSPSTNWAGGDGSGAANVA